MKASLDTIQFSRVAYNAKSINEPLALVFVYTFFFFHFAENFFAFFFYSLSNSSDARRKLNFTRSSWLTFYNAKCVISLLLNCVLKRNGISREREKKKKLRENKKVEILKTIRVLTPAEKKKSLCFRYQLK